MCIAYAGQYPDCKPVPGLLPKKVTCFQDKNKIPSDLKNDAVPDKVENLLGATNPTRTSLELSPQGESALMSSHKMPMQSAPKLLALPKNATIPTSRTNPADTMFYMYEYEIVASPLSEGVGWMEQWQGCVLAFATISTSCTNPTNTNTLIRPGGVQNPFGALSVKEALEAVILNSKGVENPSGVKNATNPTSVAARDPRPQPLAFGEGLGARFWNENTTNPTSVMTSLRLSPAGESALMSLHQLPKNFPIAYTNDQMTKFYKEAYGFSILFNIALILNFKIQFL